MIVADVTVENWELVEPFGIARSVASDVPLVHVTLTDSAGNMGHAEAAGVDYHGETQTSLCEQIRSFGPRWPDSITGAELLRLLPSGGARNALDCALWDLRAKQSGVRAWRAASLSEPQPLLTAFTLGLGTPQETRRKARAATGYPLIKLKVSAEQHLDIVGIVREEHPRARLIVDANESWSRRLLEELLVPLAEMGVEMIEQPVPAGADHELDGLHSPLPLAADESCTDRTSLDALVGRYSHINIKLDKCGGLTEALSLVTEAERRGLRLMVGNMCGTSLGMAPAHLIGQRCDYVDLDGPLLQRRDREVPMRFDGAWLHAPLPALWG